MSYLKQRPGSVEETITKLSSKVLESDYQDKFKKELEKTGKGIGSMTPDEKKKFFNKIDKMHSAKDENAPTDADMKRLKKMGMKKEDLDETHMGQTKKANQSQKDAKGEKEVIKPIKETILNIWKEAAEKKDEKKKDATPPVDNSDEAPKKEEEEQNKNKKTTDTGEKPSEIEKNPEIKYAN